jgi:hypothetical protein
MRGKSGGNTPPHLVKLPRFVDDRQQNVEGAMATFGENAVGLSFNPSGNADVAEVKQAFASMIDFLHDARQTASDAEVKRMLSIAITEAQTAQMWAVKAITWGS